MRRDNLTHPMFRPVHAALVEARSLGVQDLEVVALEVVERLRDHFAMYAEHEESATITHEPGDTGTEQLSHEAMEAIKPLVLSRWDAGTIMHVTLVVTAPEGKVAIASTEQHPTWMLEALQTGYMSARRMVRQTLT